eukprot:gnl/MRDRNA2_/MRDRNA2_87546_c0_seq1.p1 gnl/MRDRNA2_/MRDRNA2_87546_c0~~gnl/MRDRNA2_/MRDRNA2_87546_c0_seq1.p1  ORF type:complete len:202 (+),score=55.35 gnl/MRDRNA2_/MRDRNA2_87546_c0_seq1:77-682(+)
MTDVAAAKERKKSRKTREFKEYLNESGTLEAVVKLLIGLMEAESDQVDTENLLQDFFGHYRDPLWDTVEELWASNEEEQERRTTLEATICDLEKELEAAQRRKTICDLWDALAGQGTKSMPGKDVLLRLTGLKKPAEPLTMPPPAELLKSKFIDMVDKYPENMFDWIMELKPLLEASADPPCVGDRLQEPELVNFFNGICD